MSGRSKLNIIEQEFKYAEKTEFWRLKEEEEMRRTIQMKRERALTEAKRIERARRIKEENCIRRGIISAVKNQPSADSAHQMLDMCVCVYIYKHVYMNMYVYMYVYTYAYTFTDVYM